MVSSNRPMQPGRCNDAWPLRPCLAGLLLASIDTSVKLFATIFRETQTAFFKILLSLSYKRKNKEYMLIYNTTFQVGLDDARNFIIWLNESYIPEVENQGTLKNPRLTQILSHQEADSECFSLQWEVEDTATLHRWHTQQGMHLNNEMMKIFKDKVVGFPTLMEVIR